MKKFEDKFNCDCGKVFFWKYLKLDINECWRGKWEDKVLNCVNFTETANIYSFKIKCPACKKLHFVTITK